MTTRSALTRYRFGHVEIQPDERRLVANGEDVAVGPRAFDLLVALVERAGQLMTKNELLERVWPKLVVEENNLQVQVSALRKILGQDGIETVPGHGYRFRPTLEPADVQRSTVSPGHKHNVPQPLTHFVGHEDDLTSYVTMLQETRLLVLTGIGGCGKTRLAIELAQRLAPSFRDGVRFVDVAAVAESKHVAPAIASTLEVFEESDRPIEATLGRYLTPRELLLVLDNCEHLIGACASLAETLLLAAPGLRILATSREGFGIAGERTVAVRSLSVPSETSQGDADAMQTYEAVRLFVDRARVVAPEFKLRPDNASAVAEICRRLDGIPLALELAAARVRLLSVDQIRAKLDDRFRLLVGGLRAMSRHQTLLATLQWSYDHLTVDEQEMLRRLSVFTGGWTLEAATAIAEEDCDELAVLERIGRLVDKSLVLVDRSATAEPRYRMLETVRQHAQDRLHESGNTAVVRERHLAYILRFLQRANANFYAESIRQALEAIDAELSNVLAAHAWCDRAQNGTERGLQLVTALRLYWINRGLFVLGQQVYDEALGRPGIDPHSLARADALFSLGQHRFFRGRFAEALSPIDEALAIARLHGNSELIMLCLEKRVLALVFLDDTSAAFKSAQEQLAIAQRLATPRFLAFALTSVAEVARARGALDAAAEAFEKALSLMGEGDRVNRSFALRDIARTAIARGKLDRARETLEESIRLGMKLGAQYFGQRDLEAATLLCAASADWSFAARLQGANDAIADAMGGVRNAQIDASRVELHDRPRLILGADVYAAAYEAGSRLSLEAALGEVLNWMERRTEC